MKRVYRHIAGLEIDELIESFMPKHNIGEQVFVPSPQKGIIHRPFVPKTILRKKAAWGEGMPWPIIWGHILEMGLNHIETWRM